MGTKALLQSRVTHGPHCAHTQGLQRPVRTAAPAPNLWGCPVHSASSTKTRAQPGSIRHPVANSAAALACFQMGVPDHELGCAAEAPQEQAHFNKILPANFI